MGREIKRVPLDFALAIGQIWPGFLMPDGLYGEKCTRCKDGSGYSKHAQNLYDRWYGYVPFHPIETGSYPLTPHVAEVRAFAERNVSASPDYYGRGEAAVVREAWRLCHLWNGMWSHHLAQEDVDALVEAGRLMDLTHRWSKVGGWRPIEPTPKITAKMVNLWSLNGTSHDSINCSVVVKAACSRAGRPLRCSVCDGHGSVEKYEGQRAEAEAWEPTEPPAGDGWQLWSTTTEGHPESPVFATAEELATWMSQNPCGFAGATFEYDVALKWAKGSGWSPSMVGSATGLLDGITASAVTQ